MTPATIPRSAEGDQPPSLPQGQAHTWLRLLLAMTIPAFWLLIGISLTR